jgi:hypothetical protein
MKRKAFEFTVFFLLMISFVFSDLKSQTFQSGDTLIRIQRIKLFPVSNPPPQYIVEIRNDMSISFYNNLPIEIFQNHAARIDKWGIDSTTIQLDSTDFKLLEKTINEIDLENIDKIEKPISENGIEVFHIGGYTDKFIIELTNQKVEFSIGPNNEKYISESAETVRNLIEDLEEKYKPRK